MCFEPKTRGIFRWAPQAYAALLFLYYAAIVLRHAQPPLLCDFSDWIYSGALLARWMHGLPDAAHALKHYPVPNSLLTALLGGLTFLLPWQLAAKAYLLLHFTLCFAAVRSLAGAVGASPLVWFIAPSSFFLGINLWWGLFAFQLGVVILFFFVAMLVRRMRDRSLPTWPLGAMLVLLYFAHMVPFTLACLLLFLFAMQTGRWRLVLQLLAPVLLLAGYIGGRSLHGNVDSTAAPTTAPHLLQVTFWFFKINTFVKSFGFVNPVVGSGSIRSIALSVLGKPIYLLTFAANLVLCFTLIWIFFRGADHGERRHPFVWLAAAVSMIVYLVMPESLLGISDPGSRILQATLWLSFFFCMRLPRVPRALLSVAAVASIVMALAGARIFTVVPWHFDEGGSSALPAPMIRLAWVPFQAHSERLKQLEAGDFAEPVFPTGLFVNIAPNEQLP